MIFASDLDRTLIYSNRALAEFGIPAKTMVKPVEKKENKWISFMTASSFSILEEINRQFLFIPITTRTSDQFERIFIFKKEIPVTYAITSNGGHILYKGEEVNEWASILSAKLQKDLASNEEVQAWLKKAKFRLNGLVKQVENLFFYIFLEDGLTGIELNEIKEAVSSFGWRISLQGRKLYFIPKAINKGAALEYICHKESQKVMTGAGDSNLDWDFLKHCSNRLVPVHGELASNEFITSVSVTRNKGILAGEEILRKSLSLLSIQI